MMQGGGHLKQVIDELCSNDFRSCKMTRQPPLELVKKMYMFTGATWGNGRGVGRAHPKPTCYEK